uniref:B box-type domain-containing protein n=1 Tax=Gadus morhua TaxID=8049 RepID=A0A8C4ZS00_GADMO
TKAIQCGNRMCKKHNRLLELFCQTEQECVCLLCTEGDHKSHPVVPLKEEYEVKSALLGKIEADVQQMIQERKLKIKEIKDTVEYSKNDADGVIADGGQVFTALMRRVEKCSDDFNQTIKERLKTTEKQAEDLIKELEQEIEDLTYISSEVKPLSHTEDHLHFLQAFRSLKDPPPTRDWTTVEVRPPSYGVHTLSIHMQQSYAPLVALQQFIRIDNGCRNKTVPVAVCSALRYFEPLSGGKQLKGLLKGWVVSL